MDRLLIEATIPVVPVLTVRSLMNSLPQIPFARLRDVVHGRVVLPGDAEFDRARRPWNLAIEQSPGGVVDAVDADDVATVLRFASTHAVPVTAQPSGHGATGRADGAILLRTGHLDAISVDPDARTARIGAGVRSGELQRAAAAHSLTALPGSSPVVSVTGAALGGGLSWFSRRFGWMADGILSADIVLADGTIRRVDDSDPELLWALRGGGGETAIVTSLKVRLRPAPTLFGGRLLWPAAHSRAVAEAYRAMTRSAPDELTLWLELLHFPGAEPTPRGRPGAAERQPARTSPRAVSRVPLRRAGVHRDRGFDPSGARAAHHRASCDGSQADHLPRPHGEAC